MSNHYEVSFSQKVVGHIKQMTETKNVKMNYNNLAKSFDTRWVGTAGEWAFKYWLDKKQIVYDYHAKADDIDEFDFTLYHDRVITIDVKTVATKYSDIKNDWSCDVDVNQYNKMKRKRTTDLLVFVRFNKITNKAYLLGWISFLEFTKIAVFKKAGSHANIHSDLYDCRVDQLHSFNNSFVSDYQTQTGKVYSI